MSFINEGYHVGARAVGVICEHCHGQVHFPWDPCPWLAVWQLFDNGPLADGWQITGEWPELLIQRIP